jgi:Flp pilus assembly protein CpaB
MAFINPENKTQIVIIIVAVAAGVIASALVGGYVSSRVNEETTKLAVQYEKVQNEKKKQYDEQMASMAQKIGAVEQNAQKAAQETAQMVAQQLASKQAANTPPPPKKKSSLAKQTPPGKRAITVMIDSLQAIGGLVNPGDYVDVIAHLSVPTGKKGAKESVTAMVFQDLQILAINTNLDEVGAYEFQQKENKLRITFAVDPREAGLLAFAEMNGKLELVLRSPNEKDHQMLPTATWTTLAEYVLENNGADIQTNEPSKTAVEETPKVEERAEDAQPYIEIYRGGREL